MKIALLSNHAWGTANKAGFHMLAASYAALGHEVTFVTTGLSLFSVLRRDARLKTGRPLNRIVDEAEGVRSYLHFTPLHPHTLVFGFLDRITAPFVRRYARYGLGEATTHVAEADVVFFESCSAVCLVAAVKALNPRAKLVYRASDVLTCMRSLHPAVECVEREALPLLDLVSVPTQEMSRRFEVASKVSVRRHGVDVSAFDSARNPYDAGKRTAIFVGMSDLDVSFLRIAAARFSEVEFHIIGPFSGKIASANIICHGKLPFAETAAYVKFADIALGARRTPDKAVLASLGTSLKMMQYRYCGLPIVVPESIPVPWNEGCFRYRYDDPESIFAAVSSALNAGKKRERSCDVAGWIDVAAAILDDVKTGEKA